MTLLPLPRYHAQAVHGFRVTPRSLDGDNSSLRRKPIPASWQVQDSWDLWHVVWVADAFHRRWGEKLAREKATELNAEHERWLREQGLA